MKVTILGSGGSLGVPQIRCSCYVCKSNEPKNQRSRASIFIETPKLKILVDATPDFRTQALNNNIDEIDAIIITHEHSDHTAGLNDLKPLYFKNRKPIPVYMTHPTWKSVETGYSYLFKDYGSIVYQPFLAEVIVDPYNTITINDTEIQLFEQKHGEINSLGVRIGNFAYSTDINGIPERTYPYLKGLECWIVDCLRYSWAPSHACYEQTLEFIRKVNPKHSILTHMAHEVDYHEIIKLLPKTIEPGYDGMVLEFNV